MAYLISILRVRRQLGTVRDLIYVAERNMLEILYTGRESETTDDAVNDAWGPSLSRWRKWRL